MWYIINKSTKLGIFLAQGGILILFFVCGFRLVYCFLFFKNCLYTDPTAYVYYALITHKAAF